MNALATPREFYFAFGSNMHLEQMATRCPDSVIVAISYLKFHRWQINQRGVANVVRSSSPSDEVAGIVFQVSERDIQTLDRNEGISKGFYEKEFLEVELQPLAMNELSWSSTSSAVDFLRNESRAGHNQTQNLRSMETARVLAQQQQQQQSLKNHTASSYLSSAAPRTPKIPKVAHALVYLSNQYNIDGNIRAEYVPRMKLAMSDAEKLGVSSSYLNQILLPFISAKPQEPVQPKKISKAKPGVKSRSTSTSNSLSTSRDRVVKDEDVDDRRRKHGSARSGGEPRHDNEQGRKNGQGSGKDRSLGKRERRSNEDTRGEGSAGRKGRSIDNMRGGGEYTERRRSEQGETKDRSHGKGKRKSTEETGEEVSRLREERRVDDARADGSQRGWFQWGWW
ncbi:hypothetical protein VTL71DRAFT_1168 [Oculimacula yallundae]|uniref:gamma-glutamylcyclotransferase n=1 Tax=Oculimacula yallundae TaxID=86028 RepID=A0ABR4D232_9HELO